MEKSNNKSFLQDKLKQLLSGLVGCVLTFYIWNFTKMNNILVSEALTLLFTLMFPSHHDDIFFSASLAGLTNKVFLPNAGFVFLLGFFDFCIFNAVSKVFLVFGGKLGTIAFFSNLLACFFAYLSQMDKDYPFEDYRYYEVLDVYIYIFGPLVCATSCYLSYIYFNYFNISKYVAVNVNGVLNSFLLLLIDTPPIDDSGQNFPLTYGAIFNYFSQIGLLATLMKEEVFKDFSIKGYIFHHYFLVGYLAGWINISIYGFFNVGGKNGFMAFLSSNLYIRTLWVMARIMKRKKNVHKAIAPFDINNNNNNINHNQNNNNDDNKENQIFTTENGIEKNEKIYDIEQKEEQNENPGSLKKIIVAPNGDKEGEKTQKNS